MYMTGVLFVVVVVSYKDFVLSFIGVSIFDNLVKPLPVFLIKRILIG